MNNMTIEEALGDENIVGHLDILGNNDQTVGLLNVEFVGKMMISMILFSYDASFRIIQYKF